MKAAECGLDRNQCVNVSHGKQSQLDQCTCMVGQYSIQYLFTDNE